MVTVASPGLALASNTAFAAHDGSRCAPRSPSTTVLRSRRAWVWQARGSDGSNVHACLLSTGRPRWLTPDDQGTCSNTGCETVAAVSLAGRYVAYYDSWSVDYDNASGDSLIVLDLRSGKVVLGADTGTGADCPGCVGGRVYPSVVRTVLRPTASVAWTNTTDWTGPAVNEVWKTDRGGRRRLDRGTTVDPNSLRLHGSTITWTDGGSRRTASLR